MTTNEVSTQNLPVGSIVIAFVNGIRCNAEIHSPQRPGGFYLMGKYNSPSVHGAVHESKIESVLWLAGQEEA